MGIDGLGHGDKTIVDVLVMLWLFSPVAGSALVLGLDLCFGEQLFIQIFSRRKKGVMARFFSLALVFFQA